MIDVRRLQDLPRDALDPLHRESSAEGFRFVARLAREWESGHERFDRPGAVLLGAFAGSVLLAIGGITPDPYGGTPDVGRLRHVYVRTSARRAGVGRQLVAALERCGAERYRALVLRTDTVAAARFYEALGYHALPPGGTATHRRWLALSAEAGAPAD